MNFLQRLFGKREEVKVLVETQKEEWYPIEEDYKKAESFIWNVSTMEDCKQGSIMIDNLGDSFDTYDLRNTLSDSTFEIFLKQYNKQ